MATPRKPPRKIAPYMGEPLGLAHVQLDPKARLAIMRTFGADGMNEFVEWLEAQIAMEGAAARSEKLGPTPKQIRANLTEIAGAALHAVDVLTVIGSREFRMLHDVSVRKGRRGFETYKVVPELREIAVIASEAATLVKTRAGKKTHPRALVNLALQIAEKMRAAGSNPTSTPKGDFASILGAVIEALNTGWPKRRAVPYISAGELARRIVSGKRDPR